jgi:carbamoyl-phosphate synthase large subunit
MRDAARPLRTVTRPTLLFLSGGGHTGSNVMASLAARRDLVRAIATSDVCDEPALFAFDAVYLAPKVSSDPARFEGRFLEIVAREKPDLVVPCRDEDVEWLAGLRERRPDLAPCLLCGPLAIASLGNDKWSSYEFARAHDLPFVPSLRTGSDAAGERIESFVAAHGLPLIVKPRRGSDSRGVGIVTSLAQAHRAASREGHVVQRYLGDPDEIAAWLRALSEDGIPLSHSFQGARRSLQALIGPDGAIEHLVCTTNIMTGRIARTVRLQDDPAARDVGQRCAAVFAAQGWRGPLNVQCLPDRDGGLAIHEFGFRFTGASAARGLLGIDEIGRAVRAFTGTSLEPRCLATDWPRAAVETLRARAGDPRAIHTLAERGEWTRP